jgi:phosphoribosylanthranilate isomerase
MITQIYEVQTPAEAHALIDLGVDHIGSVLLSASEWKSEQLKETVDLVAGSKAKSSLIPLFNDFEDVARVLDFYRPDIVHFCEDLINSQDPEALWQRLFDLQAAIKKQFPGVAIMRSIPIPPKGTKTPVSALKLATRFEAVSDYFLTDTIYLAKTDENPAQQPVAGFVGITGDPCDWEAAAELVATTPLPVILAGGLGPENVYEAILKTRPAGVDSCTRTNMQDEKGHFVRFRKDLTKVNTFVDNTLKAAGLIVA